MRRGRLKDSTLDSIIKHAPERLLSPENIGMISFLSWTSLCHCVRILLVFFSFLYISLQVVRGQKSSYEPDLTNDLILSPISIWCLMLDFSSGIVVWPKLTSMGNQTHNLWWTCVPRVYRIRTPSGKYNAMMTHPRFTTVSQNGGATKSYKTTLHA